MGVQLNIKSEEAYELASEIAQQTGVSMTQAVLDALRAHRKAVTREAKVARVMELCREARAMMSPETLAFDIDKELYDEMGLPK